MMGWKPARKAESQHALKPDYDKVRIISHVNRMQGERSAAEGCKRHLHGLLWGRSRHEGSASNFSDRWENSSSVTHLCPSVSHQPSLSLSLSDVSTLWHCLHPAASSLSWKMCVCVCVHLSSWSVPCPDMVPPASECVCVFVCVCVCVCLSCICVLLTLCFSVEVVREMEKDQPLSFERPIQSWSSEPQQPPSSFSSSSSSSTSSLSIPPSSSSSLSLSSTFIWLVNKPHLAESIWAWL